MAEEVEDDLEEGELASSDEEGMEEGTTCESQPTIETIDSPEEQSGMPDTAKPLMVPPWDEWSGKERKRPFSPGTPSPKSASDAPVEVKVGINLHIHFPFGNQHAKITHFLLIWLLSDSLFPSLSRSLSHTISHSFTHSLMQSLLSLTTPFYAN